MKNRYGVINSIITGSDNSYTATEFYLTDENLQVINADGECQYKILNGSHVLRTLSEINSDPDFIVKYRKKKLDELKALIKENWMDVDHTVEEIKAKFAEVKGLTLNTKTKIDNAYSGALTWLGLS